MRGLQTGYPQLQTQLKGIYGRWAGELRQIENPPKTKNLKWRGRDAFASGAAERAKRAEEIKDALPHIAFVISLFDPEWRPEQAKIVRPSGKAEHDTNPSVGWTDAAMRVLRSADEFLSVAEIVEEIGQRWDCDLSTVAARQRAHTGVTKGLRSRVAKGTVLKTDGEPHRYALASRAPSFDSY